ncbi:MAG: flavodoxin domain-containing protein [Brachybacterium sp.]|uniref:flavodoxin domain-containing protein n=1 Tax=Brachybacterium sp. AOP42-C2-15 TaxID=3457670 RepID=UPI003FD921AD
MTVLVAYATHSGATRTLAETLTAALRATGLEVDLTDIADSPDPTGYDAVVLGSGVRVEAIEKHAATWAQHHAQALGQHPFAFFSCSGSAADPAKGGKQKATDTFLEKLRVTPVAVKNFPGWVLMDRIPMHERLLLKSMRTPTGDFRDLPAVEAWGGEIAPLLRPAP